MQKADWLFDALGRQADAYTARNNAEAQYEAAIEAYSEAATLAAPFMTDAGRAALAILKRRTVDQPCFLPGALDVRGGIGSLSIAEQGFIREGQNSIYRWLLEVIEKASGPAPSMEQFQAGGLNDE